MKLNTTQLKTFEDFDRLEFGGFAERLTSFIEMEREWVDGALLISLNGEFGSGKSTFFEMWQNKLESESSKKFSVIRLNTWEADYDRDALLSIILDFVNFFEETEQNYDTEDLKQIVGKVAKFTLAMGNQIVKNKTGIDLDDAKNMTESGSSKILDRQCFDIYSDRREAFVELKKVLRQAIGQSDTPFIVMVDELDRCRPDYAIEYLETIKHIFDLENLVFVLGVDIASLSSSIKALFGELNFDEYYRKFVHRRVSLPVLTYYTDDNVKSYKLESFTKELIKKYLSSENLIKNGRYSYSRWHDNNVQICAELFSDMKLNPRQLHEIFRILAHALNTNESNQYLMNTDAQLGVIFMASMSIRCNELYHKIGENKVNHDDLLTILNNLPLIKSSYHSLSYWIYNLCLSCFIEKEESISNYDILTDGYAFEDRGRVKSLRIHLMNADTQRSGRRLLYSNIYSIIEGVKTFSNI